MSSVKSELLPAVGRTMAAGECRPGITGLVSCDHSSSSSHLLTMCAQYSTYTWISPIKGIIGSHESTTNPRGRRDKLRSLCAAV